jgi:hypothetical protein
VTEFAGVLDTVADATFSKSFSTDRWATACELLSRRDELLLAGWNENDNDAYPPLVRDLARAAAGHSFAFPDETVRLRRVMMALADGQTLPPYRCILLDDIGVWPTTWQAMLQQLAATPADAEDLRAPNGSALRGAQALVRGESPSNISQDPTFRYVVTRSETTACEYLAATLAASPDTLADTVIYCEDDRVALRLDACLQRIGLPTTGACHTSSTHPVLQVLPLILSLCWKPVDPQALLDFLALPVKPLPQRVATRLARALVEEPGLGSSAWEDAILDLCSDESDPDGKSQAAIDAWLLCERAPRGSEISSHLIRERCARIAQWASSRAIVSEKDSSANPELVDALRVAASQASLLGQLVESQGRSLMEPQLARLLEEVLNTGVDVTPCIEADGGPTRVRSLAEIDAPFRRLIWLGLGTGDAQGCRWSASQLRQLRAAGLNVDDGSHRVSALRGAEARGFSCIEDSFLAILLPKDWELRWHPVWLAIRTILQDCDNPPVLEDLVSSDGGDEITPFVFETQVRDIVSPLKMRPSWSVPPGYLFERDTISATDLQDRLACPLKWVFTYQAKLRPSSIAELPTDSRLKGTFCHSVLERVFGDGKALPSADAAADEVGRVFDERLALDAAPLAQRAQLIQRTHLRNQLKNATRVLVRTLSGAGYHIVGIEVPVENEAFGKALNGSIDCLAARDDGSEAIIDFKYSGKDKYSDLIRDGKAVQLATYAFSRSRDGAAFPAVAYLVLNDAQLYSPSGSPVDRNDDAVIDGPAIRSVWDNFSSALTSASGWLTSDEPIPARPLQSPTTWPAGVRIVLDANLPAAKQQEVCRYCDYKPLCGIQGIV